MFVCSKWLQEEGCVFYVCRYVFVYLPQYVKHVATVKITTYISTVSYLFGYNTFTINVEYSVLYM